MGQIPKKAIRKLVTLPAELAERIESFRQSSGATSESDALKALIEDGLKLRDTAEDLFRRCQTATATGKSIPDVLNTTIVDHPLVKSIALNNDALEIYINNPKEHRFLYEKSNRSWKRQENLAGANDYEQWSDWKAPQRNQRKGGGRDLDDDIPF